MITLYKEFLGVVNLLQLYMKLMKPEQRVFIINLIQVWLLVDKFCSELSILLCDLLTK